MKSQIVQAEEDAELSQQLCDAYQIALVGIPHGCKREVGRTSTKPKQNFDLHVHVCV